MDFSEDNNELFIGLYDDYFKNETLFCSAFDELFNINKFDAPTKDDVDYFRQCLTQEENIDDEQFIEEILFIFINKLNVEEIRQLSHLTSYFTNDINVVIAFDKLKDLHDKLVRQNDNHYNIIDFLNFLLFEPIEFLRHEKTYLESLGFYYSVDLLKSFMLITKTEICNGKTPCVLSYICANSTMIHELMTDKYNDIEIPRYIPDKDQYGNDYFDIIITKFYENI